MNGGTQVGLATAEATGMELSAPALNLFVEDLWPQSDEAIVCGLTRRREIRGKNGFPPTLTIADVFECRSSDRGSSAAQRLSSCSAATRESSPSA
jgi:hypothetical protein